MSGKCRKELLHNVFLIKNPFRFFKLTHSLSKWVLLSFSPRLKFVCTLWKVFLSGNFNEKSIKMFQLHLANIYGRMLHTENYLNFLLPTKFSHAFFTMLPACIIVG